MIDRKKVFITATSIVLLSGTIATAVFATDLISNTSTTNNSQPNQVQAQTDGVQNPTVIKKELYDSMFNKLKMVTIPIAIPTYIPSEGPYNINSSNISEKGYQLKVEKAGKDDEPISLVNEIVTLTAGQQNQSFNPTEKQLLKEPKENIQVLSQKALSYNNAMMVNWQQSVWEFFVTGHQEGDGVKIAEKLIEKIDSIYDIAPNARQGTIHVNQLGNKQYVIANWTYDYDTWYSLETTGSFEETIKMLESIKRTNQTWLTKSYYPDAPEISSAEIAIKAYFDTIESAANLNPKQMAAAGGTVGLDKEPYPTAYNYWDQQWQKKTSYEKFLASWRGTAHVELLKLLPAGERNGEPRYFVETKNMEVVDEENPKIGIFYYSGYLTANETKQGWKITSGNLESENLGWKLGGHQPWRNDPITVATFAVDSNIDDYSKIKPTKLDNGTFSVIFTDNNGKDIYEVTLVDKVDGILEAIEVKNLQDN